jgi:hypothetical protein
LRADQQTLRQENDNEENFCRRMRLRRDPL